MKCENYLCIYEKDGDCLLKSIELDVMGQCKECIYISIEEEYLDKLKTKSRIIEDDAINGTEKSQNACSTRRFYINQENPRLRLRRILLR